jgi:hypothetical protein
LTELAMKQHNASIASFEGGRRPVKSREMLPLPALSG